MYSEHVTCQARADTPFGPMAGRTRVTVTQHSIDCVAIEFHVGPTPVLLAMAESNLHNFIHVLAQACNELDRARLLGELLPNLLATDQVAS